MATQSNPSLEGAYFPLKSRYEEPETVGRETDMTCSRGSDRPK
jgi:hypothetical protein